MDIVSALSQLPGVLVGAGVAWFGLWLKERKERKGALGVALADLLQVRHDIIGVDFAIQMMKKEAGPNLPADALPHVRTFLESIGEKREATNARYERAISILAGVDPLAAFELKSKNLFPQFLSDIRQVSLASGLRPAEMEELETDVRKLITPFHDLAVLRLARMYSWITYRSVKKYLQREPELPPEFTSFLKKMSPKQPPQS
jgi:hypothetical protein